MNSSDTKLTYELTYKDVVDILKIIDDSNCKELHLELGDLKLDIIKGSPAVTTPSVSTIRTAPSSVAVGIPAAKPAAATAPNAEKRVEKPVAANLPGIPIHTPLSGTFYRAPAPGAKPFVEVGSRVKAGDQVAIVEVMKLMNSIKAPKAGTIGHILVENETKVEMGQVLMTMNPAYAKGTAKAAAKRRKK